MKTPSPKKLPSGSWNIYLRLGNEGISVTKPTKSECIKAAELIKAEYRNEKRAKQCNETLDIILTKYIDSRRSVLSPSTIAGYETIRKNRFKKYMKKKISDIDDWQAVINAEVKDGLSPKSIRNNWGLVVSAMGYVGQPVPPVQLPSVMPATRPWLTADQIKVFVKAVHGHPVEIPALLMLHSLRRSEVLGLDWSNIDLKAKTIRVVETAVIGEKNKLVTKSTTKTRKSYRTIPVMIPELESALAAVPEKDRKGKVYKLNPNNLWPEINGICRRNNLPEVGCHGLRHSFCSLAAHVSMSEAETMMLGGWEDVGTMRRIYQHISDQDRLKAENKISAFFKSPSENADGNADGVSKHQ
jgi:integrase